MVDPDGKQLVDACTAGDTTACRRFYELFLPLIYRFEHGGSEHESASHDFITFLSDDDRLFRRLRGFRGDAPLRAYLWTCILPDLLKQFRAMIRRQHLDTAPLDAHLDHPAMAQNPGATDSGGDSPSGAAALLEQLAPDKRVLFKLLYIEDFDLDGAEIQFLAERTKRTICDVLERIETARAVVRTREAAQHARHEGAESAGQWIRLYERQLVQIDQDLMAFDPSSPRAARLHRQRAELLGKLAKRRRQQAERLRAGSHTVVTLPTDMLADLLGQTPSTTRSQITRVRQELAAQLAKNAAAGGVTTYEER
ncbi:MAG: hypothetical protein ACHQ4J_11700 [Candidatus Binatia bacterium]